MKLLLWKLVFAYAYYLLLTHPFFLMLVYGSEKFKRKSFGQDTFQLRRRISLADMGRGKNKESKDSLYLGTSLWTGKPFYLTDSMRQMHMLVTGSTGVGKTESVLLPALRHDIHAGKGMVIIDGKGDFELLARIRLYMGMANRRDDFRFFSLSHPEISNTYNPLLRGNASEIKDKLIGSADWSEEFYKKKSEEALLTLLRPMIARKQRVTFRVLYDLLTNRESLKRFKDSLDEDVMRQDLQNMENHFHENSRFLSGLIADLALISKSEFGELVDVEDSEIDLLRAYESNHVCYFSLNTQGYEETAKRFGRIVLQDLKTVSSEIQSQKPVSSRHFFGVYVDEFASFIFQSFMESLNKGRGAGFAFMMLHQSLGDLAVKKNTFQQQVLENTNIKVIMRQDDPMSIEKFAKIGGAKKTLVPTFQTEDSMLGAGLTGTGSVREGQTFRVDPDLVRSLGRGEAIIVSKMPKFHVDCLKLDYQVDSGTSLMMQIIQQEKEKVQDELLGGRRFQTLSRLQKQFEVRKQM